MHNAGGILPPASPGKRNPAGTSFHGC
jgi:hypothetical protein